MFKFANAACNAKERLLRNVPILFVICVLAIWGISGKSVAIAKEEDEASGYFCYYAESEAEADAIAEKIGAEMLSFNHGIAEVCADEDNLSDAGDDVTIYPEYIYTAYDNLVGGNIGSEQWYAEAVGMKEAWQYARGKDVLVAVVDSGIDASHGELKNAVVSAVSVIPDEAYETYVGSLTFDASYKGTQDNFGHGTHVSGIIAAADDSYGCVGVAPESGILSIKVLEKSGSTAKGLTSWVVAGIRMAIEQNADVINLSLGGSGNIDPMIQDAVDEAVSSGITIVCAAGNITGTPIVLYPAACKGVIGVSALKKGADGLEFDSSYSNYGSLVDISAPGTNIYSTEPGGYGYRRGTSLAAPIVSGAAALLLSIKNDMSSDEVAGFLYDTAHDLGEEGRDDYYGNGSVDIAAAVKACSEKYTKAEEPSEPSDTTASDDDQGNTNVTGNNGSTKGGRDSEDKSNSQGGSQLPGDQSDDLNIPYLLPGDEDDVMYALDDETVQADDTLEEAEPEVENHAVEPEKDDKAEEAAEDDTGGEEIETETDSALHEESEPDDKETIVGQDVQPVPETEEEDPHVRRGKPWILIIAGITAAGLIIFLLKRRKESDES